MQIRPYLTFKGECQEAIGLYTRAFTTGVSELMRMSDIPQNPGNPRQIPEEQKNWIIQATIRFGDNFIRMSDSFGELNDAPSQRVSIAVECSVDEVKHAFDALSDEGEVGIPLQKTFFSPCHGIVFDKFGVMWNLVGQAEK